MADLLFEIGVEELPARLCAPALRQLEEKAHRALERERLEHRGASILGTPRRLTLVVHDLALRQADRTVLVKGPPASAAFDPAGKPTRAAEGFARGQGIAVEQLVLEADERGGAYVYARRHEPGRPATDVLPDLLRELILGLEFPTSMRWGAGQIRFARPIRWLLALFGEQPVHVRVGDVISGTTTRGHRTLGPPDPLPIAGSHDYLATCERGGVMVDPARRRETIWRQVQVAAGGVDGRVSYDEDLLDEITWLVEQPYAFAGSFDAPYLDLPSEVLATSMRAHQRYFPVFAADGDDLLPFFIAVSNGQVDYIENVRHGNEKVLRARLADARFFWDEDRRHPLAERLDTLESIVFQEKLGSQYARTQRIVRLAGQIADALGLDSIMKSRVERTALLCKCDLPTLMVGEFPELQGVMGRAYARLDGEDELVATGIYEHYLPRGAGDSVPRSPTGIAVGLADRLDLLAGFFGLGLVPTGSADPFALRRAALGVLRIVLEGALTLSLDALLESAFSGHPAPESGTARDDLRDFIGARLEVQLRERGLRHDVVEAVLAAGFDDLTDAVKRAEALSRAMAAPAFASVTVSFKRVANISARPDEAPLPAASDTPTPDPTVPAEVALWEAFTGLRGAAEAALAHRDYDRFYQIVGRLKQPVDAFFDAVLVMDPDPAVRHGRLAMLRSIAGLLTRPADLGRLTVG